VEADTVHALSNPATDRDQAQPQGAELQADIGG